MNLQTNQLVGNNVKLVPLSENDFESLYRIASDPLLWEQHPNSNRYQKDVFGLFFQEAIQSKGAFLILDTHTNEIIGSTRYYDYNPETASIVIGYTFIARKYWGGNINREVKKLMLDYAFQFVNKVFFYVGVHNRRSQVAIERIGAIKLGEVTGENLPHPISHLQYVIYKN